ncbi:conserved Plasmodium protein, unknown function [Plasmodium berghei]|uniref:Telomere length regulation protein conserved domain-containing protein n=2 Tax=Plasmodium berghei TaxID=5821 RepID=A0A509ANF5_PLABA|nr:conserved Plasmodium protein, unknown function [Plasmodium berghei ANKA]CXI30542.1 conserved Plasmodium protein, unknown function [Plasmodium berghei]SCO59535.1 conserved Plasmodium protein, unknown function [Plasmodium berghei]VUC55244.1 conserved Plasmodium protein, unknown function [Plasmodium berghei ANKA]|eukprot:XP_034421057.1 conserved Plasmodium protein, unknown function [Plasmodium berghei ANKA]
MMDLCLARALKWGGNENDVNLKNVLEKFYLKNARISSKIIKLKKYKKYDEALVNINLNKFDLIDECFFVLSNIIYSILFGVLKIENLNKLDRYQLIYVWFEPFHEKQNKKNRKIDKCHIPDFEKKINYCTNKTYNYEDSGLFNGLYYSEWIIISLSKIFKELNEQRNNDTDNFSSNENSICVENWGIVFDLLKYVYINKNILGIYLQDKSSSYFIDDLNDNLKNNVNNKIKKDTINCDESNFGKTIIQYYENVNKIIKDYFSLPFILFSCITKRLGANNVERKLQIYNHIIPKKLSEDGFYKNAIKTCVLSWIYDERKNKKNYEQIVHATSKIMRLNLGDYFCQFFIGILLKYKTNCKVIKKIKMKKNLNRGRQNKIKLRRNIFGWKISRHKLVKLIFMNKQEKKKSSENVKLLKKKKYTPLLHINNIFENIFYHFHLFCNTEYERKKLLISLLNNLIPFVKIIEGCMKKYKKRKKIMHERKKLYLCLFNKNVNIVLTAIINVILLFDLNFFFIENFFNIFSKHCFPLSYAICIVDIIANFINYKVPSKFVFLLKDFERKKKLINATPFLNEQKLRKIEGEKKQTVEEDIFLSQNYENNIEIVSILFLKQLLFYLLDQFSNDMQDEEKNIFISIVLSKILYVFSLYIKRANKNGYTFDKISKDFYMYKMNICNLKIFESVTEVIQNLFKSNNEVSLYCGQIVANYFKNYMDNQFSKETYKSSENKNEKESDLLFNLKQSIENLPEQIKCFTIIAQHKFCYLNELLAKNEENLKLDISKSIENEINDDSNIFCKDDLIQMGNENTDNLVDELISVKEFQIIEEEELCEADKENIDFEKKREINIIMMMENADNFVENDLYSSDEKMFIVNFEQENEFYLDIEYNKNMCIDPTDDLFECLDRLKYKGNYIERNGIGKEKNNYDILKKNEKNEEQFRIIQTILSLPKLIRKNDILEYICIELYSILISINNNYCCLNKSKYSFGGIKLFDIILLNINFPIKICKFIFENIYSNIYTNIQKTIMLLSLQLSSLFLSNTITLNKVFEYAQIITLSLDGIKTNVYGKDNQENYFLNISEKLDHNLFNEWSEEINLTRKNEKIKEGNYLFPNIIITQNDNKNLHNLDIYNDNKCSMLKEKYKNNYSEYEEKKCNKINKYIYNNFEKRLKKNTTICSNSYYNNYEKKKKNIFFNLCNFFFTHVYTKLLSHNSPKGIINYNDKYEIKNNYPKDSLITVFIISSYNLFFKYSCNSYIYIDDVIDDIFCIANILIRDSNINVRKIVLKLLLQVVNLIIRKKKFYSLNNENYNNIINYVSNRLDLELDFSTLLFMKHVLHIHKEIQREVLS